MMLFVAIARCVERPYENILMNNLICGDLIIFRRTGVFKPSPVGEGVTSNVSDR